MDVILIFNIGSSSLKFSVFSLHKESMQREYRGSIDGLSSKPTVKITLDNKEKVLFEDLKVSGDKETYSKQAVDYVINWVKRMGFTLVAAGHRVVHGGEFDKSVVLTKKVLEELTSYIPFSPLHQPYNLNGYKILLEEYPSLFQVASFDSAFHATCDKIAQAYALPQYLTDNKIRRYGFHGLSYEYIAGSLPLHMSQKEAGGKIVVAHLGSGSTLCALKNLKSVATSIGMTSMGGLPMATRCGDVDPYLAVYLVEQCGWDTQKIQKLFYKESGLLGVSGISGDMKELLESSHLRAKLAVDIFIHRICYFTGALASDLCGVEGFVFTGGIGENSAPVREKVCDKLSWLGIEIDKEKNISHKTGVEKISTRKSKVAVWVMPTDEEIIIAKHTLELYLKHRKK